MDAALCCISAGTPLPPGGAAAVGAKAFNLARMAHAGLPVPPAFVLPTRWCQALRRGRADTAAVAAALDRGLLWLEEATGLRFGSPRRPLLVSVRSGGAVSMPGMLETVLDVGLTAAGVEGVERLTGNPRLAWDSYRRFVHGYASVVRGLPAAAFDELLAAALSESDAESERDLDHRALRRLTEAMLERYRVLTGEAFPADPRAQLLAAALAVFRSWEAPKAATYRRLQHLSDAAGTAVTVQAMVYGNAGGASGAGVAFTRNPATGERGLYLDFVFNGQGEDVVAGRRATDDGSRLHSLLPGLAARLEAVGATLEGLFADAQDFEFTVQNGALWLLQTRRARRTPWAAVRIAVDLVAEGLLTPAAGRRLLAGIDLASVVRTRFANPPEAIAEALVASVGVASGRIALDSAAAARLAAAGPVILVRQETLTDDIAGMAQAAGILTATGGRTSHAAVVARQLGRVCLVGCTSLEIDLARRRCRIGGQEFAEGDALSLDGNQGSIYAGSLAVVAERPERELAIIAGWPGG
jgi:pyruvate,orthophosphate dikinase